jgi:hypothetical protein
MSAIITLSELKTATGYDQPAAVEKCLRKNGVRFLHGRDGIYTTVDALNYAMGLTPGITSTKPDQDFDIL